MDEKAQSEHQSELMTAIGFSVSDLEANRRGILSEAQRARFAGKSVIRQRFAAIMLLAGGCFALFIGGSIAFAILLGFFGFLLLQHSYKLGDVANSDSSAVAVQGEISMLIDYEGLNTIRIGKTKVYVDSTCAAETFRDGDSYRIFYEPTTKTLLSAEWVNEM